MSRMNPHQVGQLAALASADRSTAIAGENIRTTLMDNIARAELKQKSDFQMQNAKLAQDQMKQTEALAKLDVETRKELEASSQEHASGMQQDRHMFEEEQNEEDREARKQADAGQRRDRWRLARAAESFGSIPLVALCRRLNPGFDLVATPRALLANPADYRMTIDGNTPAQRLKNLMTKPNPIFGPK